MIIVSSAIVCSVVFSLQNEKIVSVIISPEKFIFLKQIDSIPSDRGESYPRITAYFTENIKKFTRITKLDISYYASFKGMTYEDFIYAPMGLCHILMRDHEFRQKSIFIFDEIQEENVRLAFAICLFEKKYVTLEIVKFLKEALVQEKFSFYFLVMTGSKVDELRKELSEVDMLFNPNPEVSNQLVPNVCRQNNSITTIVSGHKRVLKLTRKKFK
jgi:hypothetical protein